MLASEEEEQIISNGVATTEQLREICDVDV